MSFQIYSEIYAVDVKELPSAFSSYNELYEFAATRKELLSGGTSKGSMYWTLNQCAHQFNLPALGYLDLAKADQEFPEDLICVTRLNSDQLGSICKDIDSLITMACASPASLIFGEYTFPELTSLEVEDISKAASDDSVDSDLSGFQEGEEWWYFFTFLRTFRKICAESQATNKVVLHIASHA